MEAILVEGGRPLRGNVRIPGAKNSALPLMAASLLCSGTVELCEVPQLTDVAAGMEILQAVGSRVRWTENTLWMETAPPLRSSVPPHLMRLMRSSLFFLAPLLARTGRAEITQPGGCRLGARPIDIHLDGLAAMGAVVVQEAERTRVSTLSGGLRGADYTLRFPSVGATETLLMAAATARGTTWLRGVALEPEVEDLIRFLQGAGACISGTGTRTLCIEGREELHGARFSVCPDRIVASTVLCGVAGCGGEAFLTHCSLAHLGGLLPLLRTLGCEVQGNGQDALWAYSEGPRRAVGAQSTGVYPAFCTDAVPLVAAAALRAPGETALADTIFSNRFACANGFCAMGANVRREGETLKIRGVTRLHGSSVCAEDLRGGAALVLAALQAEGRSSITGTAHLARGYEDIAALFCGLGARIVHQDRLEVV